MCNIFASLLATNQQREQNIIIDSIPQELWYINFEIKILKFELFLAIFPKNLRFSTNVSCKIQ